MPVRIYEIAKKLGIESKEVLSKAKELGLAAARVPSSSLDVLTAEYLEEKLGGVRVVEPPPQPAPPPSQPIIVVSEPPPLPAVGMPLEAIVETADSETIKADPASTTIAEPAPVPAETVLPAEAMAPPSPKLPAEPALPRIPKLGEKIGSIQLPQKPRIGEKLGSISLPPRQPSRADFAAGRARERQSAAKPKTPPQPEFRLPANAPLIAMISPIVVRDLAGRMKLKPFKVIADMAELGVYANVNQVIDEDLARRIAAKNGFKLEIEEPKRAIENAHAPMETVTVQSHGDEEEKEITRIVYSFGFAAKEHIALAERLVSEPPRERIDRVIQTGKLNDRANHLRVLRKLIKEVRTLDQLADERYAAWRHETDAEKRNFLLDDLKLLAANLRDTFPRFHYNRTVVEMIVLVAENIYAKLQLSLRTQNEWLEERSLITEQRTSAHVQTIIETEARKIMALEEFLRLPYQDFFAAYERLPKKQTGNLSARDVGANDQPDTILDFARAEKAETEARNNLAERDYPASWRNLMLAFQLDSSRKARLESEFGFLFEALDAQGKYKDTSGEAFARLGWSAQMCRLLSERSNFPLQPSCIERGQHKEAEKPATSVSFKSTSGSPEEKGEALEQAVRRLFRTFFRLGDEIPWKIRQQRRGTQAGYDVSIEWSGKCEVDVGHRVRCHIECKNYQDPITLKEVAEKLLSEPHHPPVIEHWILISPRANPSNELNRFLEEQNKELRFQFNIQVWSPETGIADFFGLEPEVYDQFYTPTSNEPHPRAWDPIRREEIIKQWKARLQPSFRLPHGWLNYLRDPSKLCSPPEDVAKLSAAYDKYIPMRCKSAAGALLEKPLLAYIHDWLNQPFKPALFLLGDFGDGKTCFTYFLARQLAAECAKNGPSRWLPLRLILKKYPGNPRDFLRQRLEEFNATVGDWLELENTFHRLVILDGFDEMSVKLDPATVTKNISDLLACAKEFERCKILVTSRTHFFENRQDAKRLMDRLNNPPVYHLAPIGRQEVTRHLVDTVSGQEAQGILARVHQMSDPIGLATKPLFLEMLKDLLASPKLPRDLDALNLYEHHIENALLRKAELLDDPEFRAVPETTIVNLRLILGEIAEELQRTGKSFVSLSRYQERTAKPFAELLWQLSGTVEANQDARSRVGARSLLTRAAHQDAQDEWAVDFCHRSMREYFVALKLCEVVESDVERGVKFLKEVPLNHEILQFAAERWRKSSTQLVKKRLLEIITRAKRENNPGMLGGYALTLLFRLDPRIPRNFDWRNKVFDGADLEEADLAGMDFRNSSFRHASFANANFEDAVFEGCDLTGVRIEETKPVIAITVSPSGEKVMALYGDGALREWHVHGKGSSRVIATLCADPSCVLGFHETGQMWLRTQNEWQFLHPWNLEWQPKAGFTVKDSYRCVWPGSDVVAIVEENGAAAGRLVLVELTKQAELWAREIKVPRYCAPLGRDAVVWSNAEAGFIVDFLRKESPQTEMTIASPEPTCLAVCLSEASVYLIGGGSSDGVVRVWSVALRKGIWSQRKILETKAHEGSVTSVAFVNDSCLASGGADRTIALTRFSEKTTTAGHTERRLQLDLRCRGMRIGGLKGASEHALLAKLIAESR